MTFVPIACRFVPYDQWFLSHFDDTAKIKHVKLWCLSKCNLGVQSQGHPPHRSVSPIIFASTSRPRSSIDSLDDDDDDDDDDGYNEDDEHSDQDFPPLAAKPSIYPLRQQKLPKNCPLVDQYTLLSFSTGAILEDEFALSWYNIRPYELLEIHPVGFLAPLRRHIFSEYIQPYFQARVRVLRSVWNYKSGRFEPPGIDIGHKTIDKLAHRLDSLSTKTPLSPLEKKRKTKVEWKARWVIIHHGTLFISKEHVTNPPLQQFALSSMTALRGADALERAFAIVAPRVVCIKFRPRSSSPLTSPPPSLPSSPVSEESKVHEPASSPDLKQTTDPGEWSHDASKGGDWMVLDMLDDHALSSILRILHRQASHPISSSFIPSSSIITLSSVPSPATSSFPSYDAIPYPEWRINTVENARKAGIGDIGKAMACRLWSGTGKAETLLAIIRHQRQAFTQYKVSLPPDIYRGSDDEGDEESEMEWEGWMRDLERQCRVKQQSENTSKLTVSPGQSHVPSTSLPSPSLSEASPSASPRIRSPSLSVSAHTQYPNIGNVIQASESYGYHSAEQTQSLEKLENTTVSTVSVDMSPIPRRRSSTPLAEMAALTKRDQDKGKHEREPFPPRAGVRTTGISAGLHSPNTSLRHARSSSNLRVSSSSPYGSDLAESVGHPGTSSPKRQSSFMRGMSLRAGKLVKGLESAIDFVDENT